MDSTLNTGTAAFEKRLTDLKQSLDAFALSDIQHGIERECLRILPNGQLSQNTHPKALGATLTHSSITTDYAESLLEFITPPSNDICVTLQQLEDIHTFTLQALGDEYLWPFSMPCFIDTEDDIRLAEYGTSNIGQMKHVYRVGLKHRYGSMMQVIAGVHFNFSLPEQFWQSWCKAQGFSYSQDTISAEYFAMIRNYRRTCWLIPYLFGASPAICKSFLNGQESTLPFKKIGKGTLYLPYATSLRMSDLGYTNAAQSSLNVCYNNIDTYIKGVREAIETPSDLYSDIAAGEDGVFNQLNKNILQIENELYSPIRPKQIAKSGEKPSEALAERGVAYIEVRALDLDPFSNIGVNEQQIRFLDAYLLYCLLQPSPEMTRSDYNQTEDNLNLAVTQGRDPELLLQNGSESVLLSQWALALFSDIQKVAVLLDNANKTTAYTEAVRAELEKVHNSDMTPSGKMLEKMLSENLDNSVYGKDLAAQYRDAVKEKTLTVYDLAHFTSAADDSIRAQAEIEASDTLTFSEFLADYFKY
jgi:glutamate--cysteine ligase